MSFLQALAYFFREACVGLVRSWRVSLLAVFTIGVSLFLAGGFLLTSRNLSRAITAWKDEARFVVYLSEKAGAEERSAIEKALSGAPWTRDVRFVSPQEGAARFRSAFPPLAELVDDARYGSLPPTYEARVRQLAGSETEAHARWAAALAELPAVETLDDDRAWIEDVETLLAFARAVGSILTAVLLGAAVFTIAAVVRLTSFLYRDEIAIMRLVGATEFFIRGPFYCEGILQGLAGAALAWGALHGMHVALAPQFEGSLVLGVILRDFLTLREVAGLAAIGAAAGLGGALVSLGRERAASESP